MECELNKRKESKFNTPSMTTLETKPSSYYTYSNCVSIGSGSFGTVFKAKCDQTGELVAIKTVYQDMRYKNRELQILRELNHSNVIKIKHYFYTEGEKNKEEKYLNVVMNYFSDSLYNVIKEVFRKARVLDICLIKLYSYQMIRSLNYLKAIGICHRDIKPQNILVDKSTHRVQFCDFGSAKRLKLTEQNVSYICSRYYRAPELIFNSTNYTCAIDMWSVGCVICEMILGQPLFLGENSIDQLFEIIKILGTPTKTQIIEMNSEYPMFKFPLVKCFTLEEVFEKHLEALGENFIDLISKILVYEPKIRIKPIDALCHPFFDDIRENQSIDPILIPALFEYSEDERKKDSRKLIKTILVPKWVR